MKRFAWWVVMLWLAGVMGLRAQSPDDAFIRVYNLIQQADTLRNSGQIKLADEKYAEALAGLVDIEKEFPNWNPTIVRFRKEYVTRRMSPTAAPPSRPTAPTAAGPATAVPPIVTATPDPRDEQLAELGRQLQELQRDRDLLQAKLREALAVQPAPIDPREMQRAEERIRQLQEENQSLRQNLALQRELAARPHQAAELEAVQRRLADATAQLDLQTARVGDLTRRNDELEKRLQQRAPAATPRDSAALTAAQNELRQTRAELDRQSRDLAALTREKQELEEQLRQARTRAASKGADPKALAEAERALKEARKQLDQQSDALTALRRERDSLEAELKQARAQAATAAAPDRSATRQVADLQRRLKETQNELVAQTQRAEVLAAEKAAVEGRLATLTLQTATSAPPATVAATSAPPPATKADRRAAKASEEHIRALQKERADLQKQVARLHGEIQDLKLRQKGSGQTELQRQLELARARLAAYEAKPVPYTEEELKLFQPGARVATATNGPGRVRRPPPAGTAPLIAEAQRAFMANRLDEAETKYAEALKLDDRNVTTLIDLGATQLERGRLTEAEANLNRALVEDPDNPTATAYLGLLRYRQERLDEALDLLSRSARLDPNNALTQNYLGIALSAKGQRGPAEAALRRAVSLQPGYAEAHANLAVIYALQKPPFLELARWHYQKAKASGFAGNPDLERILDAP